MPGLRTLRRIALSFCGALALALTLAVLVLVSFLKSRESPE